VTQDNTGFHLQSRTDSNFFSFIKRRKPSTTLLIRTCKTRKQLEHANLLSRRCLNQNNKLSAEINCLLDCQEKKPTCCFSRAVLRTNKEHCLWRARGNTCSLGQEHYADSHRKNTKQESMLEQKTVSSTTEGLERI
jgi:hypothetical protein